MEFECCNCNKIFLKKSGYITHKKSCDIIYNLSLIDKYLDGVTISELSEKNNISREMLREHIGNKYDKNRKAKIDERTENIRRRKISEKLKNHPNGGGYRKGSGRGKSGNYKGYWCDSTYELVWVIYHLDHNIKFKRNTERFDYIHNGKSKKYLPDFIKGGMIYEIKGYKDELVDIKLNSVNKPIKILYKNDIQYMFDYVEEKYTYDKVYDLYDNYQETIDDILYKLNIKNRQEYLELLYYKKYAIICEEYDKVYMKDLRKLSKYFNITASEMNKRCVHLRKTLKQKKVYLCKCGNQKYRGATLCINCYKISQRKVERPSYEQLLKEIKDTNYSAVGRKYGVSDNTIRKWIKYYENN